MTAQRLWVGIGFYGAAAAAVFVLATPAVARGWTAPVAAAAGMATGVALFVALAGPPLRLASGALAVVVVASAGAEEIVWRGLLLGVLSSRAGAVVAVAATSLAFACVHRRGRRGQLLAGLAFGGACLVSGGLVAPWCAHATYNLLVAGARP
jgi:membrane protease YdiL (CAAX protease family)